jgi:hypothetical protein
MGCKDVASYAATTSADHLRVFVSQVRGRNSPVGSNKSAFNREFESLGGHSGLNVGQRGLIREAQSVAQNFMAVSSIDRALCPPPLAALIARHSGVLRRHGTGQFLAQIKITTNAFTIDAIKTEHRFGFVEIDAVFDMAVARHAPGIEESEIDRQ